MTKSRLRRTADIAWAVMVLVLFVTMTVRIVIDIRNHYAWAPYVEICKARHGALVPTIDGRPTCFVGTTAGPLVTS